MVSRINCFSINHENILDITQDKIWNFWGILRNEHNCVNYWIKAQQLPTLDRKSDYSFMLTKQRCYIYYYDLHRMSHFRSVSLCIVSIPCFYFEC